MFNYDNYRCFVSASKKIEEAVLSNNTSIEFNKDEISILYQVVFLVRSKSRYYEREYK